MPTYEYKCDNGHVFDVIQSFSEDPLDTCEVCGAPARRVLHAPAVHFKGSGFYTTDYGKKGKKAPAGSGGGSESSKSDSDSKSDSSSSGTSSDSSSGSSASSGSDSSSKAGAGKD